METQPAKKTTTRAALSTGSKAAKFQQRIGQLCDVLGALNVTLATVDKERKLAEAARKELLMLVGDFPANCTGSFSGAKFTVEISERRKENTVLIKPLMKRLSPAVFLANCSFSLSALNRLLPGKDVAKFVSSEQTGPRVVTTAPRGEA